MTLEGYKCSAACAHRPGGSKFEVVRPRPGLYIDLFSAGEIRDSEVMACVSTPKPGGSGGMLPQENFEIYNP